MKKTKRSIFMSAMLAGIVTVTGLTVTALSASAKRTDTSVAGSPSIKEQIFKVCEYQNSVCGITLTNEEEQALMIMINESIHNYALENGCSYDEAGKMILSETMIESGLNSLPEDMAAPCGSSSGGGGFENITYITVTLPPAFKGDIFYADNEWAWNHVGMYTEGKRIIESKPDTGVHDDPIYSEKSKQHRALGFSNDSCILQVKKITDDQIDGAVRWAKQYVGKPYDGTFLFNKGSGNDAFNCSELVWKAYMYGVDSKLKSIDIDLDSNGGAAVYPNNIKNSDKLEEVDTF